jgi:hypothetical protein
VADSVYPQLPDGAHIGLPHKEYFEQNALGSSDWIALDQRGLGWWWKSKHNKHRRLPKSTPAQTYGSALHSIILEGVEAYERAYAVQPTKSDFPDLVDTIDEMRDRLTEEGFNVPPKSRFDRAGWAAQMLDLAPHIPCWHNILEDFAAEVGDRERIDSIEDYELRFLREMAISEDRNDNAEVRRLLADNADHPPLAELSVFATIDGIRRRWRFDRLFPAAIIDLKSLGAWSGRPLTWEAGDVIAKRRWAIQRADYGIHGRRELFRAVNEGRLYGGTLEQRRYLERIVAEEEVECLFLWCVYEKPDSVKGIAPVFMPIWDDPPSRSELCQAGAAKLDKAIRTYKHGVAQFGLNEPWGKVEVAHYTTERHVAGRSSPLPRVFIPSYAFQIDDPEDPSAYERETNDG